MKRAILQLAIVVTVLGFIVATSGRYQAAEQDGGLHLWILDVGQGDSILIDTPDHHQILVDGGPDATVLKRLSHALPITDKEIDLVISTHNDADHLSGLNDVIGHYKVDKIWLTGAEHTTQTYKLFTQLIASKHIPIEKVKAGSRVDYGALEGIVISPFEDYDGTTPNQQNYAGIVTFWQYGKETFLLTADVEAKQEQEMADRKVLQHVDILKVAHHGSHTSSTEALLTAITPKIAVISVGAKNRYGHPHQDILERFAKLSIPVLRTDLDGMIRFSIFADRFSYQTHL